MAHSCCPGNPSSLQKHWHLRPVGPASYAGPCLVWDEALMVQGTQMGRLAVLSGRGGPSGSLRPPVTCSPGFSRPAQKPALRHCPRPTSSHSSSMRRHFLAEQEAPEVPGGAGGGCCLNGGAWACGGPSQGGSHLQPQPPPLAELGVLAPSCAWGWGARYKLRTKLERQKHPQSITSHW